MGKLIKKLTFAGTIFIASNYIFENLIDGMIWFLDEDKTMRYKQNKEFYDIIYDIFLPYILSAFVTFKYIRKVFYIPTIGEAIRWLISFIFFSWGWVLIEYLWDLY